MHIRCLVHVINLIVQAFLHALDEADDPDIIDYFDKEIPIHYSAEADVDQVALEAEDLDSVEESDETEDSDDMETELIDSVHRQSPLKRISQTAYNHAICQTNRLSPSAPLYYNENCILATTPPPFPKNQPRSLQ